MKKALHIFQFMFSLFILFSCEPGRDQNGDFLFGINQDPQTGGGGSGSTKILKKMTSLDSDGFTSVFTYNYTGGKLSTVNYVGDGEKAHYTLSYDNNLLSKLVIAQDDGSTVLTTTLDITYNAGKVAIASGNMESGGVELMRNETNFLYDSAGKLKKVSTAMMSEDPDNPGTYIPAFTQVSDLVFTGNNLSTWKMTMTTVAPPPIIIPPVVFVANLSNYDTGKNPLATLPVEFTIVGGHFMTGSNSFTGLSLNNYRAATVQTDYGTDTSAYTYLYDSDGYPTKATAANGTLTFEYTK